MTLVNGLDFVAVTVYFILSYLSAVSFTATKIEQIVNGEDIYVPTNIIPYCQGVCKLQFGYNVCNRFVTFIELRFRNFPPRPTPPDQTQHSITQRGTARTILD